MIHGDEIEQQVLQMPIEIRVRLVETLLRSLNPISHEIDSLWAAEAEKRVEEIRTGKAQLIPGNEVIEKTKQKSDYELFIS